MKGTCNLCLKDTELKLSHIIPEFMYQNLYDEAPRRFYTLNVNFIDPNNSSSRKEQKGIREHLLCGSCEGLLSKYENIAAETIYGKNRKNAAHIANQKATPDFQWFNWSYAGFSYKDFKIFQMSIL